MVFQIIIIQSVGSPPYWDNWLKTCFVLSGRQQEIIRHVCKLSVRINRMFPKTAKKLCNLPDKRKAYFSFVEVRNPRYLKSEVRNFFVIHLLKKILTFLLFQKLRESQIGEVFFVIRAPGLENCGLVHLGRSEAIS